MLNPTLAITQDHRLRCTVDRPVGIAVVGLGYWGPNLLRVLGDNPDAEVRWICDLDRERLAKYRRRHPAARVTTRLERVLADAAVDAVIIATPVHTHYSLAAQALEAGKHVFVEKPLARPSELADDLAALARDARSHPDVWSHVRLQPARPRDQADARSRHARRHLLHLLEPGEPGLAPARRQRDLGSGSARFLDPPLLAERAADHRAGGRARLDRQGDRRRRVRDHDVRVRDRGERRAELAGAEQAAADGPSRQRADGHLR